MQDIRYDKERKICLSFFFMCIIVYNQFCERVSMLG